LSEQEVTSGERWGRKLDERLAFYDRHVETIDLAKLGGTKVVELWSRMECMDETRWTCKLCPKQFLSSEFVIKHLIKKHNIGEDNIIEAQFFNNYLLDPQRQLPLPAETSAGNSTAMVASTVTIPGYAAFPLAPHVLPHGVGMPLASSGPPHLAMPSGYMWPGLAPAPSYPYLQGAPLGTPQHQIPRIGFDNGPVPFPPGVMPMPMSMVHDPRQIRSYVDLDKPAEGDLRLNYG